ncbi:uncharacterized protein N7496_002571 [Penicillium cataractarum]|uniref:Uncharacterized protein n=1 Tax=Penicillium cataractarum TaxID=2100454 RepID=A0A9W9SPJ4_9EURO|nr:uncharacterized protein N7496_002571 [Penicillium cataractarum]KAJ5380143.1 hypothetical protein N7496_002571 [Penicillium cataractarum]
MIAYMTMSPNGFNVSLDFSLEPPVWFFSHELVKEALLQMSILISVYNDIVSVRHEILPQKSGHIDNIIPLLIYHKGLTAQEATNFGVEIIQISYKSFRSFEPQLYALGQENNIATEVDAFLQGCINFCVGSLQWTYHANRYFDCTPDWGDGEMSVVLG